ncbi:hypothetical protein [Methylibium sp.]|uniref:hypothetical protein n=1 Tax=Methylibium sp. TaxID=2067992 RepID=UPI00182FAE49|nr:hypothetical protein [Methylibium sp.]MBA3588201.1 hypothetical protein [Methylibium sp.]
MNRTLTSLRAELQTRLGFGMSGQAGIVNSPIVDSFLRSAQEQLYWQFEWRELLGVEERLTGVDQQFYDYPEDCNTERITSVSIAEGCRWLPLVEGISVQERDCIATSRPCKYDRGAQMEVWPIPRQQYSMRREYFKALAPFEKGENRTSLPSEMVFLMALANAKAHYRQPDAERYEKQLDALLNRLKAKNRGQSVWEKARPTLDPYAYVSSFHSAEEEATVVAFTAQQLIPLPIGETTQTYASGDYFAGDYAAA